MDQQVLAETIKAKEDELVALTQDLIRIPTVNPPGEFYTDCVQFNRFAQMLWNVS